MSDVVVAVNALAQLPEVPEAIDAAREACTALRWHPALRRRIPEASAESRVRGATASAALDGAQMSVTIVRDVFRPELDLFSVSARRGSFVLRR